MIGIITYHSAYNFGSTLQAYATQEAIKELGYDCEIINYRMPEQTYYYQSTIRTRYGIKSTIKDILQLQHNKERKTRANGYERFIDDYMNLSPKLIEPSDVYGFWNAYDTIVSGSDQIWNKHSNELHRSSWEYMYPYALKGFEGKKVSYASSIGNMEDVYEIGKLVDMIKSFDNLSFREEQTARQFSKLLGKKIPTVLDPTFLLTQKQWKEKLNLSKDNESYILYYSLSGIKGYREKLNALVEISAKYKERVLVITPLVSIPGNYEGLEFHPEFSTLDFMNAVYGARMVLTDSYHGSIISVNFGKNIYTICGENISDIRKTDIFKRLGLSDRIISGLNDQKINFANSIDYNYIYERLDEMRRYSLNYIRDALIK